MPLYVYECRGCGLLEERLAGLDDVVVVCTECGEAMDRLASQQEALDAYWDDVQAEKAG